MKPILNAVNYRGVIVRSFDCEKLARAWVKDNSRLHDGLHLRRIRVIEDVIYTPKVSRPALKGPFAIPVPAAVIGAG